MNVLRNEKVILVKEINDLKMIGQEYEVGNITDTSIVLRDIKTKVAIAAVKIDEFDKYFKKPKEVKGWTPWQRVVDNVGNTIAFYRTNYKKVQVKILDSVKAEASCNKDDEFNLFFGINLAYMRCVDKYMKAVISNKEEELKNARSMMLENKHWMKKAVNDLYKIEESVNTEN